MNQMDKTVIMYFLSGAVAGSAIIYTMVFLGFGITEYLIQKAVFNLLFSGFLLWYANKLEQQISIDWQDVYERIDWDKNNIEVKE